MDSCSDELFFAIEPSVSESGMPPSEAADRGLPLKPVPGRGRWYRLNPLLQAWLQTPVMGGYITRMLMASRWFEQRQQFPEALKYAVLAGDSDEVVRIASESTEALLLGQDTASLLSLRKTCLQNCWSEAPGCVLFTAGYMPLVVSSSRQSSFLKASMTGTGTSMRAASTL